MKCMVCGGNLASYFSKDFAGWCGLGLVHYQRCGFCGLTVSKTHVEMPNEEWATVNHKYHSSYHGTGTTPDDPHWLSRLRAQYDNIKLLAAEGLLPRHASWIDYGCGDGKLADMLGRSGLPVMKYDKYPSAGAGDYVGDEALCKQYAVVLNTSVFEHVRSIAELDEIAGLVDSRGVFALHTLVCEEVPCDPDWFYLLPVHSAFFTNRSMQLLFERWEFKASLYHVPSQMWFAYRDEAKAVAEFVARQHSGGSDDFHYKRGFVDYWKCEPRRTSN